MHLYNLYVNKQQSGIQLKVGDTARESLANGDKHRSSHDQLIGMLSARNRIEASRYIQGLVGQAIARDMRITKSTRGETGP